MLHAVTVLTVWISCVSAEPGRLEAQQWKLDVTASAVRYDSASRFGAAALTPSFEWLRPRASVSLDGSVAALPASQWSFQGRSAGALILGRPAARVSGLAIGELAGTVHSSTYKTSVLRSEARIVARTGSSGWWGGLHGSSGWSSLDGGGASSSWGPAAGAWISAGRSQALAAFKPFRFAGWWFPEINAQMGIRIGRASLAGFSGWRGAPATSGYAGDRWAGASITIAATSRLGLVASGGRYPADLVQHLPGGQYIALGVRLSSPGSAIARDVPAIYRKRNGTGELRFTVPAAERVEIVGEWTHWERQPLRRSGKRWVLDVQLAPGVYRFNLVVDGVRWIVPEGAPSLDDGLGGKTGLLLIPE